MTAKEIVDLYYDAEELRAVMAQAGAASASAT